MANLEEKSKQLEIREKKLRNKTILLTALVPVLTIIISFGTSWLTIRNELDINKISYTQQQISNIVGEKDVVEARRLVSFLIDADLIGNQNNQRNILNSLHKNFINEFESMDHYINGVRFFGFAFENGEAKSVEIDSVLADYKRAAREFLWSIEYNPMNYEAQHFLGSTYNNIANLLTIPSYYYKAIKHYDMALEIDSTLTYVYVDKAGTLSLMGKNDELCNMISKISELEISELNKQRIEMFEELKEFCSNYRTKQNSK